MKVLIDPKPYEVQCGCKGFVSWSNSELLAAINRLFHIKPTERIACIQVDRQGITVTVETK